MKNKNKVIFSSKNLKTLMMVVIVSLVFLTSLSISSSQAKAEFTAYSNNQITLCSCNKQINNIYVSNTGSSTEYYNLQQSLDFVDAAPRNFILKPGETQQIPVLINPLCGTLGKYDLDVVITSSAEQKVLRQEINVLNCKDFDIQVSSPQLSVCGKLQQNLTIYNKEISENEKKSQLRTFTVTGKGIEAKTVNLFPQQLTTLKLNPLLYCNSSNKASEYITEYNVTNGFLIKTVKNRNIVYPFYKAYELEINPNSFNIDYQDKTLIITVKNIGKFSGNYLLSSIITDYNNTRMNLATLEQNTVFLNPGEKKEITLILDSKNLEKKYYGQGSYTIHFTGKSAESGISYNKDIKIKLDAGIYENVYGKTKIFMTQYISPNLWMILLIIVILLMLIALIALIRWIRIRKQEKLHKEMFEGNEDETAEAINNLDSSVYKKINKINPDRESQTIINHTDIAITKIIINSNKKLKDVSLKITRDDDLPLSYEGKNLYQGIKIGKTNLNDGDVEKIIVRFKIKRDWAQKNIKKDIYLSRYRNKWEHFKAVKKGNTSEYNYYEAEIPGLSWFAIGDYNPENESKDDEEDSKSKASRGLQPTDILIAFLIMLLIFGASAYNSKIMEDIKKDNTEKNDLDAILLFIKENNLENDPHYIMIDQNDEKTVDLGKYFTDPDRDKLEIKAVSNPKNITITFKKGKAKFIPDKGFTGVRKTLFFATDGKDFAVSDEFYIIVR